MSNNKCMLEGGKTYYEVNGEQKERLSFSVFFNATFAKNHLSVRATISIT